KTSKCVRRPRSKMTCFIQGCRPIVSQWVENQEKSKRTGTPSKTRAPEREYSGLIGCCSEGFLRNRGEKRRREGSSDLRPWKLLAQLIAQNVFHVNWFQGGCQGDYLCGSGY